MTPEVEDKNITVRKADLGRDIRSFISYTVAVCLGATLFIKRGLIYAGGKWNYNDYENMAWIAEGKPEVLSFIARRISSQIKIISFRFVTMNILLMILSKNL